MFPGGGQSSISSLQTPDHNATPAEGPRPYATRMQLTLTVPPYETPAKVPPLTLPLWYSPTEHPRQGIAATHQTLYPFLLRPTRQTTLA